MNFIKKSTAVVSIWHKNVLGYLSLDVICIPEINSDLVDLIIAISKSRNVIILLSSPPSLNKASTTTTTTRGKTVSQTEREIECLLSLLAYFHNRRYLKIEE